MDVGYDIPSIARDLDWINVMTYDYHGQWDKKTGHVAPFYGHPDDDFYYFNAVSVNIQISSVMLFHILCSEFHHELLDRVWSSP